MNENASGLPPGGWYPDPLEPTKRRWWDGAAWTVHVHASELTSSVRAAQQATTRRELREREVALATAEYGTVEYVAGIPAVAVLERPAGISSAEFARRAAGYAPKATASEGIAPARFAAEPVRLGSAQTLPAWFIALSPLWYGGIEVIVSLIGRLIVPNAERPIVVPTIVILGFILIALARVDGSRLNDRGYRPVRSGWALLPVVYLGMRVSRTGSASAPMLLTYIALQLLFLAIVVGFAVLLLVALSQQ